MSKGVDLWQTRAVEAYIQDLGCCNGVKNNIGYAYADWLNFHGVDYHWRKYRYEAGLPFVPLEKDIDLLIAGFDAKYTAFLQLLKEIGCSPLEAYRLTPKNFYLEKKQVSIDKPVKFHSSGEYRMSDRLTAMVTPFVRKGVFDKPVWNVSYKQLQNHFYEVRKKIANRLKNPNIMRISLKTFRHWVGTTQYHSTKDILHVKEILRHKRIESTMVYTHLIDFPDGRYNLLLHTRINYRNVWVEKDGTITICFTEDDVKTLKELPRVYDDFDNLNKEYLFIKEKERYKQDM